MHEAIRAMILKYQCQSANDYLNALREILQGIALLGLWRSKFFDKAAFYGGTALRILYGLDRFSEDIDFSLLKPNKDFDIGRYSTFLQKETEAFGFDVRFEKIEKTLSSPIQSAFLKSNTRKQLIVIRAEDNIIKAIPKGQMLKIRLEVDTDPPPDFETETKYVLQPVPFAVRTYSLPDLFAGKMHAVLCRKWKNRVKGRDWYDLVWYISHHPELHLSHLEARMRQTGDWDLHTPLTADALMNLMARAIENLNVGQAGKEAMPFVNNPEQTRAWSREFFLDITERIVCV